jgi:hypothetical protein
LVTGVDVPATVDRTGDRVWVTGASAPAASGLTGELVLVTGGTVWAALLTTGATVLTTEAAVPVTGVVTVFSTGAVLWTAAVLWAGAGAGARVCATGVVLAAESPRTVWGAALRPPADAPAGEGWFGVPLEWPSPVLESPELVPE